MTTQDSNSPMPNIWQANLPPMHVGDQVDAPPLQITEQPVSCQPSFGVMFGYMDGMLDGATQADLARHLNDCQECGSLYRTQEQLRDLVGSACQIEPPTGMADRVFGAILAGKEILAGGGVQADEEILPVDEMSLDGEFEPEAPQSNPRNATE